MLSKFTFLVITTFIGNTVYYMFANYQDNNLIHEDDGDYEVRFKRVLFILDSFAHFNSEIFSNTLAGRSTLL